MRLSLDRDDFRLIQSKIMTAIYLNRLERDFSGKPLHTFPHPALETLSGAVGSPDRLAERPAPLRP